MPPAVLLGTVSRRIHGLQSYADQESLGRLVPRRLGLEGLRHAEIRLEELHQLVVAAAEQLDADELADLAPDLPQQVVYEVMDGLDSKEREQLQSALSYTEDQVGSLMDFELVKIRADVTLEVVLRYLRRFEQLPDHTDKIFVVDEDNRVQGVLPLKTLLVSDPDALVEVVMARDVVVFHPEDDSGDAAQAFERYDLITAPVVNADNQLIGRLTVDEMVDVIREESDSEVLSMAGLKEEEDLFASVWDSVKNRWAWLAINLVTAFVASRVIGVFEGAIEQLVALAALMPIVAGIGGNSGNQTTTMIVRGIGLLKSPQEISEVVVAMRGGAPVIIGDVARVVQSHTPRQGSVGQNDKDDVVQGIVLLKRGENPSVVLDDIHTKVAELNNGGLPEGMHMTTNYDRSDLVGHTLATVQHNLLFGATLIVAVLWLFLRSVRGSLIVATVIPLSLLVAFIGLHLLGMPANLISMGAIDFGIMVDGAVVLAENIIRNARLRKPQSANDMRHIIIDSAVAVAKPTLFAMAIVIAALIPVFSLQSIEGRIFRPLAMTYSFALLGALVFAMGLVPALCALFLKPKHVMVEEPKIFDRAHHGYQHWIGTLLGAGRRRVIVIVGSLAILGR